MTIKAWCFQITFDHLQTQVEDHEREVARLVKLLEQERKEKEEEAEVFHKKVNQAGFWWYVYAQWSVLELR